MDFITSLNLTNSTVLIVMAVIIAFFTQVAKKFIPISNKWSPIVAIILGIIVGIIVGLVYKDTNIAQDGLAGLLLGILTTGGFNTIKNVLGGYENIPTATTWKPTEEQTESRKDNQ